ncbi:tyrosine-type recombinase/integrase [uncultured Alistipes sp.]|uniref:tyrosine-type recombinase/integrase n=1 Tax=uncultured Alistipes sp. TaxID=538949 RepID=UPI00259354A7|nr:tyrosine-type recombinase/integrase [uncultured Alistipes sp.]
MYECKQNGEDFFSLLAVTCSRFGNRPANGLVTEQPQYSVVVCIFSTLQNTEISLIPNGLRLLFTCSLLLALPCIFHVARHTFASHLANAGVPLYIVAKLLGDKSLDMVHRVYTNTERTELTEAMKKLSA